MSIRSARESGDRRHSLRILSAHFGEGHERRRDRERFAFLLWHRLLGSRRLSLADYVMETGPHGGRPPPEGASVGYALEKK